MEIIKLKEVSLFSQCPAYYHFAKKIKHPGESRAIKIIRTVIQKCYLRITKDQYRTQWRTISDWVSKAIYKDVDMLNDAQVQNAQTLAEYVFTGLRHWYDDVYLKETCSGYTDIGVNFNVHKYRIEETIPVVRIDEVPSLIIISDVEIGSRQLYNSLEHRGYGWLFTKELEETSKVKIEHLAFGPKGSFHPSSTTLNAKDNASTEKRIMNILYCMNAGVNYPSITSMCNGCQFFSQCNI